jgi:glycosyltransferase involved in cell wall biosynthesis
MDQRKKILYVITKSNWGGAQRYVFDLATSLPKEEFDSAVALGGTGEKKAEAGALAKKLQEAGVRTIFIKSLTRNVSGFGEFSALRELIDIFKKERPNIIHLNSSKAITLGALAGRLARVPSIISTVHGWAFNEPRSPLQTVLIRLSHWIGVALAHRTIVVSLFDLHQVSHWRAKRSKIVHINNGTASFEMVDKIGAREHLISLCPALGVHKDAFWVGTNSELHKNKGLDFLLTAFAKIHTAHPETIVVIASSGEEKKNLEDLAQKLDIKEKVFLLGYVENARQYLHAYDVFTLTSRKEGLPYALLEAGLASLPVVASKTGGIPEIIESGESGVLARVGDTRSTKRFLPNILSNIC